MLSKLISTLTSLTTMANNGCNGVITIFKASCYAVTLCVVIFWLCKCFVDDDDVSLIAYKPMQRGEVKQPVMSLCIGNPFLEDKLKSIRPNLNALTYMKFLSGDVFDEGLRAIDFDNVTIDLADHIKYTLVVWSNGTVTTYSPLNNTIQKPPYVTFSGFMGGDTMFLKCFCGLKISFEQHCNIENE